MNTLRAIANVCQCVWVCVGVCVGLCGSLKGGERLHLFTLHSVGQWLLFTSRTFRIQLNYNDFMLYFFRFYLAALRTERFELQRGTETVTKWKQLGKLKKAPANATKWKWNRAALS